MEKKNCEWEDWPVWMIKSLWPAFLIRLPIRRWCDIRNTQTELLSNYKMHFAIIVRCLYFCYASQRLAFGCCRAPQKIRKPKMQLVHREILGLTAGTQPWSLVNGWQNMHKFVHWIRHVVEYGWPLWLNCAHVLDGTTSQSGYSIRSDESLLSKLGKWLFQLIGVLFAQIDICLCNNLGFDLQLQHSWRRTIFSHILNSATNLIKHVCKYLHAQK